MKNQGNIKKIFDEENYKELSIKKWPGTIVSYHQTKNNSINGILNHTHNHNEQLEFDIEYENDCWFPLIEKGGTSLPEEDDFGNKFSKRNYYEYPINTRLGLMGGPIIEINRLKHLISIL